MDQRIIDIEQLVAGRLDVTDSSATFGSMLASRIRSNLPALIHVRGLSGWASFVLSNTAESLYCSGLRCAPEHCLATDGSTDLTLICRAPVEVCLFRVSTRAMAMTHIQRGTCRLVGDADGLRRIRASISSLHAPLEELATLSPAAPAESSSTSHRTICIERGRRYIHANLGGALRIANVCEAAGVRSRTLEYGFRELFGVSPVSYIKALRLNNVRRLLCSSAAARRTITAIALDNGFWHLSQFAADYQRFFGESPSSTRRRSLSQAPAPLREARSASGF